MEVSFVKIQTALLWVALIVSAIFVSFPDIDIWFSGFFASAEGGFPAGDSPTLQTLRWLYIADYCTLIAYAAIMLLLGMRLGSVKIPARIWIFVLACYALGPLLLINVVLKENWGRARPAEIVEFGGNLQFTPAYIFSDQCGDNCSFASGEGSAIIVTAILICLLLWRELRPIRWLVVPVFGLIAAFGACLRIFMGRHFLSDVLLGGLFCALIILLLYWRLDIGHYRKKLTLSALYQDTRSSLLYLFSFSGKSVSLAGDVLHLGKLIYAKIRR